MVHRLRTHGLPVVVNDWLSHYGVDWLSHYGVERPGAGRDESWWSDQGPPLTIRSVAGSQPATSG